MVVLCSVLVAAVLCEVQYQHPEEWQLWKTEHEKSYGSQREELERHFVWLANREYINTHNANSDIFGFTLAMNHFGDMVNSLRKVKVINCFYLLLFVQSDTEYRDQYLTYNSSRPHNESVKLFDPTSYTDYIPEYVDWRTMSAVTAVKRQVGVCKHDIILLHIIVYHTAN